MTNKELKIKIIEILSTHINNGIRDMYDAMYGKVKPITKGDYEAAADALIAAGLKFDAEVAERALKDIAAGQENLTIKVNGKIWSKEEIYKQWIEQAEKELEEENNAKN